MYLRTKKRTVFCVLVLKMLVIYTILFSVSPKQSKLDTERQWRTLSPVLESIPDLNNAERESEEEKTYTELQNVSDLSVDGSSDDYLPDSSADSEDSNASYIDKVQTSRQCYVDSSGSPVAGTSRAFHLGLISPIVSKNTDCPDSSNHKHVTADQTIPYFLIKLFIISVHSLILKM